MASSRAWARPIKAWLAPSQVTLWLIGWPPPAMHSAGALYVTHPHSQVGYRWEAPKVSSPEDSQELRPAPAPALTLRPRPCRRSRPRPAASGRRGVAQKPRRAREAPAGAPPPHLRRARPPAPPTVAIKGTRAARSPSFVRCLGSASVYSSVRSLVRQQ